MKRRLLTWILLSVCSTALLAAVYVWWVPKAWLGDIFFGEYPALYNVDVAQTLYHHALKFEQSDTPLPYTYYQLSRTYFIQGELDEALLYAYKELEYYPEHWRTYYIIGLTLGYMDREEEAIDFFGKFLEHKPESWAARNDKAWLHFRIGDIDGALATIKPATEQHYQNPWVMNTYGVLLMNTERFEEAKVALETARLSAASMTASDWGKAYPGNAVEIYDEGLEAMRASIEANLLKAEERLTSDNSDLEEDSGV